MQGLQLIVWTPLRQKDDIQADVASESELGASSRKTNNQDQHHSEVGSKYKAAFWQESQNKPDDPEVTAAFWQSQNETNDQGAMAAYGQRSPDRNVDPRIKKTSRHNSQDGSTGQRVRPKFE